MTGLQRLMGVFARAPVDRPPVLPIAHTALAPIFGLTLGDYFSDTARMASVIVQGYRRFSFDGVQLSLGVTGEAESLGARRADGFAE